MTHNASRVHRRAPLLRVAGTVLLAAGFLQGCNDVTDSLLEATDPDLITPSSVQSAEGAQALYIGSFTRLRTATTGSNADNPGAFLFGGLMADEWSTSSTYIQNDEADQRKVQENNSLVTVNFRALHRVRTAANQAIAGLREYRPAETVKVAEMYFHRGFAEMQLGLDFCNGVPVSDAATEEFLLGNPETGAQLFARAAASFDSAITLSSGTAAENVKVNRAARIGKARALLALGSTRAAEAATTVAGIPTSYTYDLTHSLTGGTNNLWGQNASSRRFTVGDSVEGNARNLLVKNAIPFHSAQDPRLPSRYTVSSKNDTTKSQDGFTFSRTTTLYGQLTNVPIANGVDARMVEAEARLAANDFAGMVAILNALRAAPPAPLGDLGRSGSGVPAVAPLPALATPATRDAAIDLFFREKAFWTFSRGQRLGDLRRLVRQYGRAVGNVFPSGAHYRGGDYGADVNFPVPTNELVNPNFTGCIDRNA